MNMQKSGAIRSQKTLLMVEMGILTAIVIVLQALASSIRFGPFSITLVLAPIVIGAALGGWKAGAWLGFVFGVMVLLSGDANPFLAVSIPGTIITCIAKGMTAGALAGLVYRALEQKSQLFAVIAAAIVCPVANTGVFLLGCVVFFLDTIRSAGAASGYSNAGAYMLFGIVGLNFVVELAINLALSTTIVRVLEIIRKRINR